MADEIKGFPPVFDSQARVLIVGSMPGIASLKANAYYAHPRNAFWPMLYAQFDQPCEGEYAERVAFAKAHHIAIWDSAYTCERQGSLDTAIKNVQLNDFTALFSHCTKLRAVLCNGTAAHTLYMKTPEAKRFPVYKMPSTSPAHASLSFDEKCAQWSLLRELIKEDA